MLVGWSGLRAGSTAIRAAAIRRSELGCDCGRLAGSRVRYGYRRLTVLLRREGWAVNAKRVYRLYRTKQVCRCEPRNVLKEQRRRGFRYREPSGRTSAGAWIS